jgi:hypothetical protein
MRVCDKLNETTELIMKVVIEIEKEADGKLVIDLAKRLGASIDIQDSDAVIDTERVSEANRLRRVEILTAFKGCLAIYDTGYVPPKHEWYEQ